MIFCIPSGKHRARPFRFGLYWNRFSFTWDVRFTESCRYDLKSADQFDINKLCGIGFIPGGHHKNSARFGWRYNEVAGIIELSAYCYINGQRVIKHVANLEIGKVYRIQLRLLCRSYYFICLGDGLNESAEAAYTQGKKLSYRLGTYFGGNRPAPHEIKIELKRL
jgi:hypothetical protein